MLLPSVFEFTLTLSVGDDERLIGVVFFTGFREVWVRDG